MKVNVAVEPPSRVAFSDIRVGLLFVVRNVAQCNAVSAHIKINTTQAMQLDGDTWAPDMHAEVMPVYEINIKVRR